MDDDTTAGVDDSDEGLQLKGSTNTIRLGSSEDGSAFYALPTSSFAHAARHSLTKVEAERVKKAMEARAIAELERERDAKAAKAAGVPLKVPSAEEAAKQSALRVVQETKGIETAPRLARLEDVLAGWPVIHGLNPPPAATIREGEGEREGEGPQSESRFVIASSVPGDATAAEVQEACVIAFGTTVVSCEPWPASPSSWCIGLWTSARAKRALTRTLTVHGQPVTLIACPNQDVPEHFVLDGVAKTSGGSNEGGSGVEVRKRAFCTKA